MQFHASDKNRAEIMYLYDNVLCVLFQGFCNINSEVFLSLPCILGTSGVVETLTLEEDPAVQEKLQSSAGSIHDLQQQLKL